MPTRTRISPELLAEVKRRRDAGEQWKAISRDLRERGLPSSKPYLWSKLGGVCKRQNACDLVEADPTPPA